MAPLFAAVPLLFAQAAPPQNGLLNLLLPLLPILPLFYLLIIRPQQQQEKKRKEMIRALKRNDKVLTMSGMYGTVHSVDADEDRVVLRVDEDGRVKIPFTMSSVVRVIESGDAKPAA